MSEQHTPPDGHLGPGPDMIAPPQGFVPRPPEQSVASPQSPGETVPGQAGQPQPPRGPGRARTVLIIVLAAVLVLAAGFGTWWFFLRGNGKEEVVKPVAGLGQAPQIAWEGQSGGGVVGGVPEGLLLAPNTADGETRLRLFAWDDGSERWSVDIGERIGGAVSIQINTKLSDGLFGLVVTDAAGKNRFLVHRASDGGFVRELDLGHGSMVGSDTKAVYHYEPDEEAIGKVRISRIPDIAGSGAAEWTIEVAIEPQEGAFMVRERDGFADLCWVNEFGADVSCFKSMSLTDGSAPSWYSDSTGFVRIDGIVVASEHNNGRLAAYDSAGNQIWQKPNSNGPLHVFKDALLVGSLQGEMVERLDPRTGGVQWGQNWGSGYPTIFDHGGQPVVLLAESQEMYVGVADMGTGKIELEKYSVAFGRVVFRTADGNVIASDDRGEGVQLVAIKPGQPEMLWKQAFDGYTYIQQEDQYLILSSEDKFAVLR